MINTLITSQTRIKLLRKFFLNGSTTGHLRGLESEFGESSNAIRVELNRFEGAGLLRSHRKGNRKFYQANNEHPLFSDIHSILLKEAGIDKIVQNVVDRIGDLQSVYLTGDFARGRESRIIDLLIVGEKVDKEYLDRVIGQVRKLINREINYVILGCKEADDEISKFPNTDILPLWGGVKILKLKNSSGPIV